MGESGAERGARQEGKDKTAHRRRDLACVTYRVVGSSRMELANVENWAGWDVTETLSQVDGTDTRTVPLERLEQPGLE